MMILTPIIALLGVLGMISLSFLGIKLITTTEPYERKVTVRKIKSLLGGFFLISLMPAILKLLDFFNFSILRNLLGEETPNKDGNADTFASIAKALDIDSSLAFYAVGIVIFILVLSGVSFFVYEKLIKREDDKSPVEFETYDVEEELSYEDKLKIFKYALPLKIKSNWEEISKNISFLKGKNFYTEMFNETDKMLNDIAVKSVIKGKVSNESVKEFENALNSYGDYVATQVNSYHSYEARQLEEAQPYINAEFKKIKEVFNLMNEKPLDYK